MLKARTEGGALGNVLGVATVATVPAVVGAHPHRSTRCTTPGSYYVDEDGGIDFPGDERARTTADFAYVGVHRVGMTYRCPTRTSTAGCPDRGRSLLGHSLLSYLFGTVIIAVTINLVAGLVH